MPSHCFFGPSNSPGTFIYYHTWHGKEEKEAVSSKNGWKINCHPKSLEGPNARDDSQWRLNWWHDLNTNYTEEGMRRRWREADKHRWGEWCNQDRASEADGGQVWKEKQAGKEHRNTRGEKRRHISHKTQMKGDRYDRSRTTWKSLRITCWFFFFQPIVQDPVIVLHFWF